MVIFCGYKYCFSLQEANLPSYTNGIAIKLFFVSVSICCTPLKIWRFLFSNFWVSPRPYWLLLCVQSAGEISSGLRAQCDNEEFWYYLVTLLKAPGPNKNKLTQKENKIIHEEIIWNHICSGCIFFKIRKKKSSPLTRESLSSTPAFLRLMLDVYWSASWKIHVTLHTQHTSLFNDMYLFSLFYFSLKTC